MVNGKFLIIGEMSQNFYTILFEFQILSKVYLAKLIFGLIDIVCTMIIY